MPQTTRGSHRRPPSPGERAFELLRRAHREHKIEAIDRLYPRLSGEARDRALLREQRMDRVYLTRARSRLVSGVTRLTYDPNLAEAERRRAVRRLIEQEISYLGQHVEAANRRMLRESEYHLLRESGDPGAYWWMDPRLKTHTPDCLVMEGKVWTWDVLDVINPANRHAGCGCRLISVARARQLGFPLRRGYRNAAMRHAADVREALRYGGDAEILLSAGAQAIADTWYGDAALMEAFAGVWREQEHPRGKTTPRSNRGSFRPKHVTGTPDEPGGRELYVHGEVQDAFLDDLERMVSAHAAGQRDEVERLHRKLRAQALKLPVPEPSAEYKGKRGALARDPVRAAAEEERQDHLRIIDRVRAALDDPRGARPVVGQNRLLPLAKGGITAPWSADGRFAWIVPPTMWGDATEGYVQKIGRMEGMTAKSNQAGESWITTAKDLTDDQARARARLLEIALPEMRRQRAIEAGELLDNDRPLDVGPKEPRAQIGGHEDSYLDEYKNITWGQQGDAGELALRDVAERLQQLGKWALPDPTDKSYSWDTRGLGNTPIDWYIDGLAIEAKAHSWRGQTPGVLSSGPSVSPEQRMRKQNEMERMNRIRKKEGKPPLQAAIAHLYTDFDNDTVHVIIQRYSPDDAKPFASRRLPLEPFQAIVDAEAKPGQMWVQKTGTGAGDVRRHTMYVGSFRLRFNPLKGEDVGRRIVAAAQAGKAGRASKADKARRDELLRARQALPTQQVDTWKSGDQAFLPSASSVISQKAQAAGRGAASKVKREHIRDNVLADLRRVKAGEENIPLTTIAARHGISNGQVSKIANRHLEQTGEDLRMGQGRRSDVAKTQAEQERAQAFAAKAAARKPEPKTPAQLEDEAERAAAKAAATAAAERAGAATERALEKARADRRAEREEAQAKKKPPARAAGRGRRAA